MLVVDILPANMRIELGWEAGEVCSAEKGIGESRSAASQCGPYANDAPSAETAIAVRNATEATTLLTTQPPEPK